MFYSYYTLQPLSLLEQTVLGGLSLIGAVMMYRWIEQPFRRQSTGKAWLSDEAFGLVCLLTMCFIALVAARAWQHTGWQWRTPAARRTMTAIEYRNIEEKEYCMKNIDPSKPKNLFSCQNFRNKAKDIIVWGDSHARHLIPGLSEAYPDYNVYALYMSRCTPQSGAGGYVQTYGDIPLLGCVDHNKAVVEFLRTYKPSTVILASAKLNNPEKVGAATNVILKDLESFSHNAFLLGDIIVSQLALANCNAAPEWLFPKNRQLTRCVPDKEIMQSQFRFNAKLKTLVHDAVFLSDIQCPNSICMFSNSGGFLFRDGTHLNILGSIYLIDLAKDRMPID